MMKLYGVKSDNGKFLMTTLKGYILVPVPPHTQFMTDPKSAERVRDKAEKVNEEFKGGLQVCEFTVTW